ncbi:MAG: fused MFS/spermidine synthase [Firmicutes bacterium]|nr:fused MFS/spermidine synthase [Bacillota bacterium]
MRRKILDNKTYLYLTEFFSGMSLMAVELGASRLMAPYFSSSQIVWTIIIGTIMIAMALGNIFGGRWADKDPNPDKLYRRIIIAACWIGLIPVLGKYVILGISGLLIFTVSHNLLVIAAFITCMVIFVFPLFLLGTVTPSLVKYTMDSLEDNGRIVGKLNASNTIGSIIGTFVPTFVSIPAVGTSITFLIFSGILLALSIIYFTSPYHDGSKARPGKAMVVGCVIFLISCLLGHSTGFAFWEKNIVVEDESIYNYIKVTEDDKNVTLSTNVLFGVQSIYPKNSELTGMYYDYAMAAPYMAGVNQKDQLNVLILGMGTGTYATQCLKFYDNMNFEGVEIDDKIADLAYEYFALPESVKVTKYDGRAFLNAVDTKYDLIMVDAYQDISIPFQMASVEFFTMVRDHLTDDGVMVVNMNMRSTKEGNINQYLSDTISSVFSEVYTVDVPHNTNRELFASNASGMIDRYLENVDLEKNKTLADLMVKVFNSINKYVPGDRVMTDDKAPVELLSMRAIDELVSEELAYYQDILHEEGIRGLMDRFL